MKQIMLFLSFLFFTSTYAQQKHDYKVVKTYHVTSQGGWDYILVHKGRIYLSHGMQVNILDEKTGDSVGVIPNTNGVHGIAFDEVSGKGYTSNGRGNNVTVFDGATNKVITTIATGENPDAITYDPFSKRIITCNGRSKNLSVIDPATDKLVNTIDVGGKPETGVGDGKGKFFVNIEDKNEIVVVDLKSMKVVSHWSIAPGEAPTGLDIDPVTNRLFAGCDNKMMIVVDALTGKVIAQPAIGNGCDGVAFDPIHKLAFASNGEGTVTAIREISAQKFQVEGNYPSKRGARTIAIDPKSGALYLPTADFEAGTPAGQRPKMIPGTFQVLVME